MGPVCGYVINVAVRRGTIMRHTHSTEAIVVSVCRRLIKAERDDSTSSPALRLPFCFSGPSGGDGMKPAGGAKCLAVHQVVKIQ